MRSVQIVTFYAVLRNEVLKSGERHLGEQDYHKTNDNNNKIEKKVLFRHLMKHGKMCFSLPSCPHKEVKNGKGKHAALSPLLAKVWEKFK